MTQRHGVVYLFAALAFSQLGAACSDTEHSGGGTKGVFRSATVDYIEEGRTERVFALERDGTFIGLQFSQPPNLPPGTEIVVYGPRGDDGIRVDRFDVVRDSDGIGQQRQALINPTPLSPPLRAALVSLSPTYTKAMLDARITKPDFIKPILEMSSYGIWTMEWETLGPFTVARDCGGQFAANIGNNATAAMKAAGVDTTKYNQFQFILGSDFPCSWSGFGLDGHTPIRTDGKRGMYNPWSYTKGAGAGVMTQEIGHNWGLAHSHFCPGAATPAPNCANYTEYGSPYTPMATSNTTYLNGWERIQMNFLGGCNVITVGTSGMYDIGPLTLACNGPQVLRIAADKAGDVQRYFYIEYRMPAGIEKTNGVLLHYTADIKKGGWNNCDYGGPDCPEDWLVNPKGGSASDAVLAAGTEWTTPQNVKVKIASLGTTAKIELTFATPGAGTTCLDDTMYNGMAPVCQPVGMTTTGAGGAGGSTGAGGAGGMGGGAGGMGGSGDGGITGSGAGGSAGGGQGGSATTTTGVGGATGGVTAGTTTGSGGVTAGTTSTSGTAGNTVGSGGSSTTGDTGRGSTPADTDTGCGCRVPGSPSRGAYGLVSMAALAALVRRRRQTARPR